MKRSKLNRQTRSGNARALRMFSEVRNKLAVYQPHLTRADVPLAFAPSGRTVRHRLNHVNLTNADSPRANRDHDVL